eukprot:gene9156-biopygen10714
MFAHRRRAQGHRTQARAWCGHGAGAARVIGNYWLGWRGHGAGVARAWRGRGTGLSRDLSGWTGRRGQCILPPRCYTSSHQELDSRPDARAGLTNSSANFLWRRRRYLCISQLQGAHQMWDQAECRVPLKVDVLRGHVVSGCVAGLLRVLVAPATGCDCGRDQPQYCTTASSYRSSYTHST